MINLIIIDRAHGSNTPGKYSPKREDGTRFYEWQSSSVLCRMLAEELDRLGIRYEFTVNPDDPIEPGLAKRVERANAYARGNGASNTLFISLHHNAAKSDDQWHNATGWAAYTSPGKTKSDEYAEVMYRKASEILTGKSIRRDRSDGDSDQEANFYVLRKTICPAVLVEAFFQDTKKDVEFIESAEGRELLTKVMVESIKEICGK